MKRIGGYAAKGAIRLINRVFMAPGNRSVAVDAHIIRETCIDLNL